MLGVKLEFNLVLCQEGFLLLKKSSAPVVTGVGVYQVARGTLNARVSQRVLFLDGID
jgi:hypothetical protein